MKLLKLKFVPNRRIFYMSYDKLEVRFSLLTSVVVLIQAKVPPPPKKITTTKQVHWMN